MITTHWDRALGIVRHHCSGLTSMEEVVTELSETIDHRDYLETKASLWDMRGGEFQATQMDIKNYVPALRSIASRGSKPRKVAWVVQYEWQKAVMEQLFDEHDWTSEWRTFTSESEAFMWRRY